MTATFDRCFEITVGHEGGYTNDPADPGGETNFGISKASYPDVDIANLTLDQAKAIYFRDYWTPVHGDDLPPPLALLVFDAAVNNGLSPARRWLQLSLNVAVDGQIGPITLAAARDRGIAACPEYLAQRIVFMASLPTWRDFGLGWSRRLAELPYQSLSLSAL